MLFRKKKSPIGNLRIVPEDQLLPIYNQQTVLDVLIQNQIPVSHSCGGMGTCTTCLVRIESHLSCLPPRTAAEGEMALMKNFSDNERLSCQLLAFDGLTVCWKLPQHL
jgi:ferredoxin